MNDEQQNKDPQTAPEHPDHPIATGLGAVSGGVAGAAIGKAVGGRVGAAIGTVTGAIAGGMMGNTLVELTEGVTENVDRTFGSNLGADTKPIELPRHYSWDELRALSKPQSGSANSSN